MIFSVDAVIDQLSIHNIGNKSAGEFLSLSENPVSLSDDTLKSLLKQYFTGAFEKNNEVYRLSHATGDLSLNEVYYFAQAIFRDAVSFHENSRKMATYLYDIADHPKIRSGELYIAYFRQLQLEGELHDAIGIFKSETKQTYLKLMRDNTDYSLSYEQEAIDIKKLDKGCLIFNTEEEEGYKVMVVDHTNRQGEAVYWVDDFLKLKVRNDAYNQTHSVLNIYKHFITEKIDESLDVSKPDKIDLLNRSIRYFKDNEQFEMEDFSQVVLDNPVAIKEWKEYKNKFEEESGTAIGDSFSISGAAVKKQSRHFKSVLKLDKNFHIYIHGNRDMIERGFDESVKLHYYKVYFSEEQ